MERSQVISDFALKDARTQQQVSLKDFGSAKGIVVIFTSNYCPYSKLYDNRIKNMANAYSGKGIQFLLVNPNTGVNNDHESIGEMARKAREEGYDFPYLADATQEAVRQLGAQKTPEAFLLTPQGNGFRVVYSGAIDDNPQVEQDVKEAYLRNAIDALLSNNTAGISPQRPTGCMIKKKRQ
ncbi:thioredoxin family protein [Roseivirga sp. BDSF3-8]|uniref:thioredoxin family protein n=1 Tax=Roseivirga sp. BDSF3-8 TaxID=3241598 RepID=UPI003531D563